MSEEKIVCMNDKNYASFRMFVKEKELWNHLDGFFTVLTYPYKLGSWESKDVKVVSWLLSSIEPHMVINLLSFNIVKEI